jgi:hypothetical protein
MVKYVKKTKIEQAQIKGEPAMVDEDKQKKRTGPLNVAERPEAGS